VLFVGGEALSRGVCQKIAKQLRTAAQSADPVAWVAKTGAEPSVGVDLKQPQPGWAAAMGLALSPTDL
jgi:Tfp pilus assembly PilM family ATPase